MSTPRTMPPPLDLLVIGAGPVGLATAVAALHRGAKRVLVVEQARDLRPVGSFLDFPPNAFRVACALAPGIRERLEPFVRVPRPGLTAGNIRIADGTVISTPQVPDHGPRAVVYWWQLQKILLDVLPNPDIVVLNHQLVDVQHEGEAGLVRAEFVFDRQRQNDYKNWDGDDASGDDPADSGGNADTKGFFDVEQCATSSFGAEYGPDVKRVAVRAKVIVGADGINSVARRCVYRDTCPGWEEYALALHSGMVTVVAQGSPPPLEDEQVVSDLYVNGNPRVFLTCSEEQVAYDCMRMVIANPQKGSKMPFRWILLYFLAISKHKYESSSQEDLMKSVTELALKCGYAKSLVNLSRHLWASGGHDSFSTRAYCVVPATHPPPYETLSTGEDVEYPADFKRPWHCGRVVLAGDAIHASPPFLGQGSAMGLEDALELVTRLTDSDIWSYEHDRSPSVEVLDKIFDDYRTARLDRVCFVQQRAMNRVSEFEVEKGRELYDKIWARGPDSVGMKRTVLG